MVRFEKYILLLLLGAAVTAPAQVVHRLTTDRFSLYRIDDWISYGPSLHITSVDIDNDYIYFGTRNGGILRFDKYENKWDYPYTTSSGLRSNFILRIVYSFNDGYLYAQTPAGVDVYKPAEKFWRPAETAFMPQPRRPKEEDINTIQKGKDYRFPPYFRPPNSFLPDFFTPVSFLYQSPDRLYDQQNREFHFTDRITDTWQRVWFGTDGFGPLEGDLYSVRLERRLHGLPDLSPRDIYIDGDSIWIGGIRTSSSVAGITHWDRKRDTWTYFGAPFISQLYRDDVTAVDGNQNYIVFATMYGLSVYDLKRDKWYAVTSMNGLEGDHVLDVVVDHSFAYVASENGFNYVDLTTKRVFEMSETILDNVRINQLALEDSILWAATRFGLYKIDIFKDRIFFTQSQASVVDYDIQTVGVSGSEIWFAGEYGISFWNRETGDWRSFPALEFKAVYRDIAFTKNCVWFATNQGLLKYDRKKEYWRLYTERDGLISNDVFNIDQQKSRLLLTTGAGVTSFRWHRKDRID